jgi:hypothetical protein
VDPASGARVVSGAARLPTLLQAVAGYAALLATFTAAWQVQQWHRERTEWVQLTMSTRELVPSFEPTLGASAYKPVRLSGVDYSIGVRVSNRGPRPITVAAFGVDGRPFLARLFRAGAPAWFLVPEVRVEPGEIAWVGVPGESFEAPGFEPAQRLRGLVRLASGRVIASSRRLPDREISQPRGAFDAHPLNGWRSVELERAVTQLSRKIDRIGTLSNDATLKRDLRRLERRLQRALRHR